VIKSPPRRRFPKRDTMLLDCGLHRTTIKERNCK
jgi:hypothetical protein